MTAFWSFSVTSELSTQNSLTAVLNGLDVEDFEEVYLRAKEIGAQVQEGYFPKVYELPDRTVQLYLRDPAGNKVEVNYPDAAVIDCSMVG